MGFEDPSFRYHGLTNTPLNGSRPHGNGRRTEWETSQGGRGRQRCEETEDGGSAPYRKAPWERVRGQEGRLWAA